MTDKKEGIKEIADNEETAPSENDGLGAEIGWEKSPPTEEPQAELTEAVEELHPGEKALPKHDHQMETPRITSARILNDMGGYSLEYFKTRILEELIRAYNKSQDPHTKQTLRELTEDDARIEEEAKKKLLVSNVDEEKNKRSPNPAGGPRRANRANPQIVTAKEADALARGVIKAPHVTPEGANPQPPPPPRMMGDYDRETIVAPQFTSRPIKEMSAHLGPEWPEYETIEPLSIEELGSALYMLKNMHLCTVEMQRWNYEGEIPYFQAHGFIKNLPKGISVTMSPTEKRERHSLARRLARSIEGIIEEKDFAHNMAKELLKELQYEAIEDIKPPRPRKRDKIRNSIMLARQHVARKIADLAVAINPHREKTNVYAEKCEQPPKEYAEGPQETPGERPILQGYADIYRNTGYYQNG